MNSGLGYYCCTFERRGLSGGDKVSTGVVLGSRHRAVMVPAEGRPVHTRRFSVFSPERLRTETSDLSDEGR